MTTKQALGNDYDSFITLIKRFASLSSESATQIENNRYAAREAIRDALGSVAESVNEAKEALVNKESIQLNRLNALKGAKSSLIGFQQQLEASIKTDEEAALTLIAEIEAM
jgi:hypothetical protein